METLRRVDDETIRQVRDRIMEACDPQSILLFGSAVRGETRPGSDIDLLVVVDLPEGMTRHDQASKLYGLFRDLLLPIDIIVRSPEQFEHEKRLLGMISHTADKEGVRIYERS
jgi:predicted nucleotidyltransferase